MRTKQIKLIQIGNSRGVRLTKDLIEKYGLEEKLILEEKDDGILIRSVSRLKLSWEDTFRETAAAQDDWSDFDITLMDGLEDDGETSDQI